MERYSTAESWTGLPGEIVPADGNYAPPPVAPAPLPAGFNDADAGQNRRQDASATDRDDFDDMLDRNANNGLSALQPIDLGPNNERLEDVNPKVVHALRELVRQYREEGVVARRNEIRRIRQARLFWQGLQYAWWNPNDMNCHLPYENRSSDDRQLAVSVRHQFLSGLRPVVRRSAKPRRSKCAVLSSVSSVSPRYFCRARCKRRGDADRAEQQSRRTSQPHRLFPLDRRQAWRLRPLRRRRPALRLPRRKHAGSARDPPRRRRLRLSAMRERNCCVS